MSKINPFVFWGQTTHSISLLVKLQSCKDPYLKVTNGKLTFEAYGIGANGLKDYGFEIFLYEDVDCEKYTMNVSDRDIEIILMKKCNILWPRLLFNSAKPAWLKVDFDKMKQIDYESSDDEIQQTMMEKKNNRNIKDRHFGRGKKKTQDFKITYLFLYNLFQFCGFLYLFTLLTIHLLKEGPKESIKSIYQSIAYLVKFLHLFQILEILHPLCGLTFGSALPPTIQLSGRCFFIFGLVNHQIEIQHDVYTFYLFYIYAFSEVCRYPYYMLHVFHANIWAITWLRYSAWIVLYPLGFITENVIIYKSIPLAEKSGLMSFTMPNSLNFSFYAPGIMRFYFYFGTFFFIYYITLHMYRQRSKILNSFKTKIH